MKAKRWTLTAAWVAAAISAAFAVLSIRAATRGHTIEANLTTVDTVAGILNSLVATIGIIAGAIWAYYKFLRGRTFVPRATLEPSILYVGKASRPQIIVGLKLQNVGLVKLDLDKRMKYLKVFGAPRSHYDGAVGQNWELVKMRRVFEDQEWVEPGTSIEEHLIYNLPTTTGAGVPFSAYKVVSIVGINYRGATIGLTAPRIHARTETTEGNYE